MSDWRTEYWRVYNILVRVLGGSALVAGTGFVGWGAGRLIRMGLERSMGEPGLILMAAGLLSGGLGAAIMTTPAYRPDLGDPALDFDPYGQKTRQAGRAERSWWTGDLAAK
jgi:hypothetical protein